MRCSGGAVRCARARPEHPDGRRGRPSRCRAARGSWRPCRPRRSRAARRARVHRARRMRACVSSTARDCTDPSMNDGARGGGRLEARARERPALDDESQIGLADLGAIEGERARAGGRTARVPHAHALVGKAARLRQSLPGSAQPEQPLRGAARARTPASPSHRPSAHPRPRRQPSSSAMSATRARSPRAAARRAAAAMVAPTMPAPTTTTSKSRLMKRLESARRARAWVCGRQRRWTAPTGLPSRAATDRKRAARGCAAAAPVPRGSQRRARAHR